MYLGITNNKKAVSLIVSYTLLIVITLTLAVGVGAWLKYRASIPNDDLKCPEGTSLIINDYHCNNQTKILTVNIKNKGRFKVNGFFLLASNNTDEPATYSLIREGLPVTDPIRGRYDFGDIATPTPLNPEKSEDTNFQYLDLIPLKKIRIQPFIVKDKLTLCENIIYLDIDDSKECH